MKLRVATIAIAALVACTSDSAPTGAGSAVTSGHPDPGINKAVIISNGASSLHQQETTLAQSSSGRIVVVWIGILDQSSSAATIEYAISEDSGTTWRSPAAVAIPPEVGALNDPALVVDAAGNFTLAALGFTLPGARSHAGVYVYRLAATSTTFGAPISVDQLDADAQLFYFDKPQIALTAAGYLVTYSLFGSGGAGGLPTSRAGIAATSADGSTWRHDTVTTSAPSLITSCVAGQAVTTVYLSMSKGGLWAISSSDGGLTWGASAEIDAAATGAGMPACVRHGGDLWVLYATSGSVVRLTHSGDDGAHFAPIPIAFSGSVSTAELGVRNDGTIDIAYYNSTSEVFFGFVHALLLPGSTTLQAPDIIRSGLRIPTSRQGPDGIVDFVGVIPGAIAFTDNSSGTSHIAFFRESTR